MTTTSKTNKGNGNDDDKDSRLFEKKIDHTRIDKNRRKLECGPMPNLMVALMNIGGALCPTTQSSADAHY